MSERYKVIDSTQPTFITLTITLYPYKDRTAEEGEKIPLIQEDGQVFKAEKKLNTSTPESGGKSKASNSGTRGSASRAGGASAAAESQK
ncbi:MAG: hypothetical protein MK105_02345 [Crocinitomicaceae bacterium]|nr:hypothetical protein [Crocinitomicaceae bacterium]